MANSSIKLSDLDNLLNGSNANESKGWDSIAKNIIEGKLYIR